MEGDNTKYINGDGDDFTFFLFSDKPKEDHEIKLEISKPGLDIQFGLHLFQELLMIFTSGMKYLFSDDEGNVDITSLSEEDIIFMNKYFKSIGFTIEVNKFTIIEYLDNMKLPNYFINKHLIKESTSLKEIYYETTMKGHIYRITFDFLR